MVNPYKLWGLVEQSTPNNLAKRAELKERKNYQPLNEEE